MASKPGSEGGGNVDPDSGEPVETTPRVEPDQLPQGTPGDEPFPPPPKKADGTASASGR